MRRFILSVAVSFVLVSGMEAQQKEINPENLVNLMRLVNTLQIDFKVANYKFANTDELLAGAKTLKPTVGALVFVKELSPSGMVPYTLQVIPSEDGAHYLATIKRPSDMHNQATWCKTAVFSDDSGLVHRPVNSLYYAACGAASWVCAGEPSDIPWSPR